MKSLSFFIFSFLIHFIMNGQAPILFQDEFNDNKNNWWLSVSNGAMTNITNGKLIVSSKINQVATLKNIPIDGKKDFVLETDITVTAATPTCEKVGFCFAHYENSHSLSFIITRNKESCIEGYIKDKYTNYSKLAFNPAINEFGKTNKIKIEQKGVNLNFYVNDVLVHSLKNISIPGNYLGYETYTGSAISIDAIVIYQKIPDLKFVEGFTTEKRERLSAYVNTVNSELGPVISQDGKYLFYNRRQNPRDIYDVRPCDDVWFSEKLPNGTWGPAQRMSYPINDIHNNDIIAISPDNNTIFLHDTSCAPTNEIHFFVSHRTATGWTKPVGSTVTNGYNLSKYFAATVSADKQFVITSLVRKDGYGSADLYVLRKTGENQWSEPVNLGNVVNSFGGDDGPFLAADGKTLYFSSDGRKGLGEMDIYVTKRLDDTWTNWSEPENLGPSVNTKEWDMYYTVDASAEYAYYSSYYNNNNADIFRIKLPKEAKPEPVVLIAGKVLNSKTAKPVEAIIIYEDLATRKKLGEARSEPVTGNYKIILPYGENYAYRASAEGYIAVSENLTLADPKDYNEIHQDLFLVPIEVGETIKLNNVFFEQGKETILDASYAELDRLVEIMKQNSTMEIELRGHTDNVGDPGKNLELSEKRVEVVKNYLVLKGIETSRISGKGFGGTMPVASNEDESTKKLNRRVEFMILKK